MTRAARPIIQGRLLLQSRSIDSGEVLATRRVCNTVLRGGAELIAGLFDGSVTTPINAFALGIDPDPSEPPYEATELTTTAGDGTSVLSLPAVTLANDAMSATVDTENLKVVLGVHGVMPADRAVSPDAEVDEVNVAEAALGVLSADGNSLDRIYNRVVFEPIPKRRNHELAFFWEIDFPYGT